MTVPARLSLTTLGVADVARSTAFYQALGWPLSSSSVAGDVSFFATAGGLLGLYGRADLAADASVDPGEGTPVFRGVTLAINVESRPEVDAALDAAVAAGGSLVKPAKATDWGGYSGGQTQLAETDLHVRSYGERHVRQYADIIAILR